MCLIYSMSVVIRGVRRSTAEWVRPQQLTTYDKHLWITARITSKIVSFIWNIADDVLRDVYVRGKYRYAPLAAGQLAELTGLTTAAITGVVDRLEKAEYVNREADPTDRRKVLIIPNPARQQDVYMLFSSLSKAITELTSGYSDKDLELIYNFVTKATEILYEQTRNLRQT
jgi:DNA-binding MarR family transcriptional regulator